MANWVFESELDPLECMPGEEVYWDTRSISSDYGISADGLVPDAKDGPPAEAESVLPSGVALNQLDASVVDGTVAADADPNGEYFLSPWYTNWDDMSKRWYKLPIVVLAAVSQVERPAPPTWDDEAHTVTLPELVGIVWTIDGDETGPGTFEFDPGASVIVKADTADGYKFEDGAGPSEWEHTFPAPDPEEPGDGGMPGPDTVTDGGRMVARWLRWEDTDDIVTASYFYWVVSAFVNGYTRGRGFKAGRPAAALQPVIVSAAARLAINPENLKRIDVDNVSESRTVFEGFTIAELGVLNNYRRRFA